VPGADPDGALVLNVGGSPGHVICRCAERSVGWCWEVDSSFARVGLAWGFEHHEVADDALESETR
jgi:hypothetical protein